MQKIMAYAEYLRWKNKKIGGKFVDVENDVFQLGKKRKGGSGQYSVNKCYVQALGERGGDIILEVFPNPRVDLRL